MTRRVKSPEKRRSPAKYTDEQIEFVKSRYNKISVSKIAEMFNETFPDNCITQWQIYRMNYKYGFKMRKKVKKRESSIWTEEMVQFCREHASEYSYREMAEVVSKQFGTKIIEEQVSSMYTRYGIANGRKTTFYKGRLPFNKGMKWDDYLTKEQQEVSKKTWFKPGSKSPTSLPVGTIVKRKEVKGQKRPYAWIKVRDGKDDNFVLNARYVYEQAHGVKLKRSDSIVHLDGNSLNDSIENLFLISDKESPVLNNCYRNITDPETKLASILTVRTKRKIKEIKDGKSK